MIGLMKSELGGKIMTGFVALRAKMYAYVQKSVWFLKVLRLMATRPAYLMVKRYIESKRCLRIRSMRCKRLISIRLISL